MKLSELGIRYGDIDLKKEFDDFVEQTGWWMVVRSMDLRSRSQYWNEQLKTAIGGPKWQFKYILVKGRRVEIQTHNAEAIRREGFRQMNYITYFIKSDIPIKKEDQIIEIREKHQSNAPSKVHVTEYFDIQWTEQKNDAGLIFYKCYCDLEAPKGDETLRYGIPIHIRR